jgi:hypothetical protein
VVNVIVVAGEACPALLVVVTASVAPAAVPDQVRLWTAEFPNTVPGVYVQPPEAEREPKVDETIPDSLSVPVELNVTVAAADGRK